MNHLMTTRNSFRLVNHPEEGTNISPETLVSGQECRRVITQKLLYKNTKLAEDMVPWQVLNVLADCTGASGFCIVLWQQSFPCIDPIHISL